MDRKYKFSLPTNSYHQPTYVVGISMCVRVKHHNEDRIQTIKLSPSF